MVKIYSKIELNEELKKQVLQTVNEQTGKKFTLTDLDFILDTSILSGIRIDIDSEVIDLTLNNRIHQILDVLH